MAIVRASRPNLAELSMYRPFLDRFDLTFFFSGLGIGASRAQLDAFGLQEMRLARYWTLSDLFPFRTAQRALDYKIGVGSYMMSQLGAVLSHDYINVVDPIFAYTHQIAERLRPEQKLIVVRWENLYGRYERVWLAGHRARRVLERADFIVCVSQAALSTLRVPPTFKGKILQIYPAIDMRTICANRDYSSSVSETTAGKRRPVALFVGRLQWTKGLQTLLVALSILRARTNLEVNLWVIGAGDKGPFQELAKELGLTQQVTFLGSLTNSEVRNKMQQADLFCFPSLLSGNWMEQFGFAVVEAMAHGLPVVVSDSGSLREICGEDAMYASTGNAHSLADRIVKILDDATESWKRGERLRQRALLEFCAERQGQKLIEAIS
jgi:glycosyltransferase involved in cell wall biosynthesis